MLALLLGCVEAPIPAGQCRDHADCTSTGDVCLAPDYDPGCGDFDPGCLSDEACGPASYCALATEGCVEQVCRERCADDSGCAADERCDGASGECRAASCDADGHACPEATVCDPQDAFADRNGCTHPACSADADCDVDLYCVGGRCFAEPGTCGSDEPPP